jgi:hypothetical protein
MLASERLNSGVHPKTDFKPFDIGRFRNWPAAHPEMRWATAIATQLKSFSAAAGRVIPVHLSGRIGPRSDHAGPAGINAEERAFLEENEARQ